MTYVIKLSEIFSRFYSKVEANDLFFDGMSEDIRLGFLCEYLHTAASEPYVTRLFASLSIVDSYVEGEEVIDGTLEYDLKRYMDKSETKSLDKEFVIEVFAMGMGLAWVDSKTKSLTNIEQMVGTSNEKYYSQAAHLAGITDLKKDLYIEQRALIRDRGAVGNKYLDGALCKKDKG